jgi:hypothetical protein
MKTLVLVAAIFAASPVSAEPNKLSQHPRVGELAQINFNPRSERLSVDYNRKLGEVAGWAVDHPDGLIVVDGFAAPGEKSANEGTLLSLHRAEAVRDGLIAQGIDPDRIVVAAFGARGTARVIVWGTREPLDEAVSRLQQANAVAVVWGTQPRAAVAGR